MFSGFDPNLKPKGWNVRGRPNLSYGDVHVEGEEAEGDGSQQEIEVEVILGVEHSNLGVTSVLWWNIGDTLNLSICHLEGICFTDIPPIDRFAWKESIIFSCQSIFKIEKL